MLNVWLKRNVSCMIEMKYVWLKLNVTLWLSGMLLVWLKCNIARMIKMECYVYDWNEMLGYD